MTAGYGSEGTMNPRQLQIFHAVMRCGTITAAADFLGITQPAVSKAMQAMERGLGFKLLRPLRGRLYPTPEAERLLPDADRIMNELSAFQRLTGEVRAGGAGLIRVAASSASATALLPMATALFRKAHPEIRVSSHLAPARDVAAAVADGQADFGISLSPATVPGVAVRTLGAARMVVLAPHGHTLLKHPVATPALVAPYPLISFGSDTYFGQLLDEAFDSAGVRRDVSLQVTMSITAACHVQQGLGVALADHFTLELGLAGIGWRPFEPTVLLPVTLMTDAKAPLSRHAAGFIRAIEKVVREKAR